MDKNWECVKKNAMDYLGGSDGVSSSGPILDRIGESLKFEMNIDIKHLLFKLSRYKFAAKLFRFCEQVDILELGCGEAIGSLLLLQNMDISSYVGIDFDKASIQWNKANLIDERLTFVDDDFNNCSTIEGRRFDAILSLDVIEHIPHDMEETFSRTIVNHLNRQGVTLIGTPHVNMDPYASPSSKIGHINLFDQQRLYELMKKSFENVFIFNMNDENVNMSFDKMSCYIFALCCNPII